MAERSGRMRSAAKPARIPELPEAVDDHDIHPLDRFFSTLLEGTPRSRERLATLLTREPPGKGGGSLLPGPRDV
jgi:hypothetical protein